jgi:hypothetical protein
LSLATELTVDSVEIVAAKVKGCINSGFYGGDAPAYAGPHFKYFNRH